MPDKKFHFYSLDLLRGVAALAVLVVHYPGFVGAQPTQPLPFYDYLFLFYSYGAWAVQVFWMISGFVFAFVYIGREVTFKNFFVNRFARLYPLHFITLCFIAFLYLIIPARELYNLCSVCGNNDPYHFFLNLFMASAWGFQDGHAFNVPIWSISFEIPIYFVYLLALPYISKRPFLVTILLLLISWRVNYTVGGLSNFTISGCAIYFFTGVLAYLIASKLRKRPFMLFAICFSLFGIIGLSLVTPTIPITNEFSITLPQVGFLQDFFEIFRTYFGNIKIFIGFFGVILLLAAVDYKLWSQKVGGVCQWVGNLSYATYLWHIPMQVLILVICVKFGINQEIFYSRFAFIAWLVFMVIVGRLSYVYIESPARKLIRGVNWTESFNSFKRNLVFKLHFYYQKSIASVANNKK